MNPTTENLSRILTFVQTAESLSFVGASRHLGVSASAVGKTVARLEKTLGVRLFQRSTRTVRLTDEGRLFYERCRKILDDLQDAEAMVSEAADAPRGRLRVSLPTIGYRFLVPHLAEFHRLYPEVQLDLDFSDRLVDIIEDGFDAVIRSGDLPDSRLMSRLLGPFRFVLCASPAYIAAHGMPRSVAELADHNCLQFRFPTSGRIRGWPFADAIPASQSLSPLTCSNMEAIRAVTVEGLGVGYMPDFLAHSAIEEGTLCRIPLELPADEGRFWVIWPSSRQLSPKIRVFVDFVCARLFTAN
ncbi:DNA-binding transcriptional LysR family regulator [Luteibacter sp. Sphag1AF]|uniref:LysR substrate-binding domain-containing protein n=1 Tax=Luteibacter sp. Sphag1AF TaxID=2587031 RepID=UPI00161FEB4F|nr:LysR substrate-binding domain-containing protein [Luteibacter sp. Sphag1AF]MBB3227834.1 DNA-binding transcriptional LysR family regulator [Luteibacter sp. Sphag1AF]